MATEKQILQGAMEDTAQWMIQARDEIDALFGTGYAKNNPGLVSTYMRVTAENLRTAVEARTAGGTPHELANIAVSLSNVSKHVGELARAAEGVAMAANPLRKARR
jgi:hypothetical protein